MKASHFLVASIVVFSAPSLAATVAPVEGELKINTGSGFKPVAAAMAVAPGDVLIVSPGGKAEIIYSESCRVPITPGQVAMVAPFSPCARGEADQAYKAEHQDYTDYYLIGGGVAAAGVGVGIWALTRKSNSSPAPASP
jgi:hypothetical protein